MLTRDEMVVVLSQKYPRFMFTKGEDGPSIDFKYGFLKGAALLKGRIEHDKLLDFFERYEEAK